MTNIRIKRGDIRAIYYKFTYPDNEDYYHFQLYRGGAISGCLVNVGLVHMSIECDYQEQRVTEYHALIIDTTRNADNIDGANIVCRLYYNDNDAEDCRNSSRFTVIVYNEGNGLELYNPGSLWVGSGRGTYIRYSC